MFVNLTIKPRWVRRRQFWHRFFLFLFIFLLGASFFYFKNLPEPNRLASFFYGPTKGGDSEELPPITLPPPVPVPVQVTSTTAPTTTAVSVIVKDVTSGTIIYDKNANENRALASITKLMSSLVLLDSHPDWAATTTVVSDNVDDTHMYAGDTYTMRDLWNMALIASSNKAILSMVDALGQPRAMFVERMNNKARELGMSNTVFVEPTGLDEGNTSNAFDTSILLNTAMNSPEIHNAVTSPEYEVYSSERKKKHHVWNTDWLLLGWVPHSFHVLGGKTGYTPAAGYNVALEVEDDLGHTLDVVVFGAATNEARFTDARDIVDWVYQNFSWSTVR
jgi:D-alanyl-D-alanine endopeptidase (penicillin-binding protein 7)